MNNIIDLVYKVYGNQIPSDHNHRLLGALSRKLPAIHNLKHLSINTIAGIPDKKGKIQLTPQSKLRLRLPVEAIAHVYQLADEELTIGEHTIKLGNPQLQTLQPIDTLEARLVTIKGYTEPQSFLEAAQRQLQALQINANIGIPANEEGEPKRLTLKIKKYTIVGFSVVVSDLNPDDSIKLQVHGLGGKRRLGCGVFCPKVPVYRKFEGYENNAKAAIS